MFLISIAITSPHLIPVLAAPGYGYTTPYALSRTENGIEGFLKFSNSSLVITNRTGRATRSYGFHGRTPKLSRLEGGWPGGPVFLLTTDQSIGFGSYNGVITQPFQVVGGELHWAAIEGAAHEERQVSLMRSLKTSWKAEASPDKHGLDLFKVACRPDFKDTDGQHDIEFTVSYIRYHFDGRRWTKFVRTEPGFWENEDDSDFPPRRAFP